MRAVRKRGISRPREESFATAKIPLPRTSSRPGPWPCAWNAWAAREGSRVFRTGAAWDGGSTSRTGVAQGVSDRALLPSSHRVDAAEGATKVAGIPGLHFLNESHCYLHGGRRWDRAGAGSRRPRTPRPVLFFFLHVPTNTSDMLDISVGGRRCGFEKRAVQNATATQPRPGGAMVCRRGCGASRGGEGDDWGRRPVARGSWHGVKTAWRGLFDLLLGLCLVCVYFRWGFWRLGGLLS